MNCRVALAVGSLAGCLLLAPGRADAVDESAAKERIGGRIGGIATFDGLNDAYGGGWGLALFFHERLTPSFFLDFRLGAIYVGDLKIEELDDELLRVPGISSSMRFLYITGGLMYGRPLGGGYAMYGSAGGGIYSVSMVFDTVNAPNVSDQRFGVNGGLGLSKRLSENWSLDLNATTHYFFIDENIDDVYFAFTDGADPPLLLDIGFGIIVDLR